MVKAVGTCFGFIEFVHEWLFNIHRQCPCAEQKFCQNQGQNNKNQTKLYVYLIV